MQSLKMWFRGWECSLVVEHHAKHWIQDSVPSTEKEESKKWKEGGNGGGRKGGKKGRQGGKEMKKEKERKGKKRKKYRSVPLVQECSILKNS
jgi:hypothetical protein